MWARRKKRPQGVGEREGEGEEERRVMASILEVLLLHFTRPSLSSLLWYRSIPPSFADAVRFTSRRRGEEKSG